MSEKYVVTLNKPDLIEPQLLCKRSSNTSRHHIALGYKKSVNVHFEHFYHVLPSSECCELGATTVDQESSSILTDSNPMLLIKISNLETLATCDVVFFRYNSLYCSMWQTFSIAHRLLSRKILEFSLTFSTFSSSHFPRMTIILGSTQNLVILNLAN